MLWYPLAELETAHGMTLNADVFSDHEPLSIETRIDKKFWMRVLYNTHTVCWKQICLRTSILELFKGWEEIESFVSDLSKDVGANPLMLFVWDEARTLVETGIDRKERKRDTDVSKFRVLRRGLSDIGRLA